MWRRPLWSSLSSAVPPLAATIFSTSRCHLTTNASSDPASTIYALASAAGIAAVSVFRLSGPRAREALTRVLRGGARRLPLPRQLVPRTLCHPRTGRSFDRALVVQFPAPHSFTGEDVVELHVHGGLAVIRAAYAALESLEFVRLAEPGEFTRRALLNGKLDASQVEATADILHAESIDEVEAAAGNLGGALRARAQHWRQSVQVALALLETVVDFGDEHLESETEAVAAEAAQHARTAAEDMEAELRLTVASDGDDEGFTRRDQPRLVLYGRPNVGKSSLFNVLLQREAAIVSDVAGTTRDVLQARASLSGARWEVLDTAGMRSVTEAPESALEREGMQRAARAVQRAEVRVLVHAGPLTDADLRELQAAVPTPPDIVVLNKADVTADVAVRAAVRQRLREWYPEVTLLELSCVTRQGVLELLQALQRLQSRSVRGDTARAAIERGRVRTERQRIQVASAVTELQQALAGLSRVELAAEHLRNALGHLTLLSGESTLRFWPDKTLEVVFSRFCIGK